MSVASPGGLRRLWAGLRTLLGDDAYDRYVAHLTRHHADRTPLSRADFYRAEQERRWSGINRCC